MDHFVAKLAEYGLKVRNPSSRNEKEITVKKRWNEIKEYHTNEEKVEALFGDLIYVLIEDKETFVSKLKLNKALENYSSFVIENVDISYDTADKEFFFNSYIPMKDVEGAYLKENLSYYEERYPKWKLKRMFDDNADRELLQELYEERRQFEQHVWNSKEFERFFQEMTVAIGKVAKEIEKDGFVHSQTW